MTLNFYCSLIFCAILIENTAAAAGLFDYCNSTENLATMGQYFANEKVFKNFIGMAHDTSYSTFGLAKPAVITGEYGMPFKVIPIAEYWGELGDYICYKSIKLHPMPKNAVNKCNDETMTCQGMAECLNATMHDYHCMAQDMTHDSMMGHDINISMMLNHDADPTLNCGGAMIMAKENCDWKDKKMIITAVTVPVGVAGIAGASYAVLKHLKTTANALQKVSQASKKGQQIESGFQQQDVIGNESSSGVSSDAVKAVLKGRNKLANASHEMAQNGPQIESGSQQQDVITNEPLSDESSDESSSDESSSDESSSYDKYKSLTNKMGNRASNKRREKKWPKWRKHKPTKKKIEINNDKLLEIVSVGITHQNALIKTTWEK